MRLEHADRIGCKYVTNGGVVSGFFNPSLDHVETVKAAKGKLL
jgi:hypothetical protein